MRIARVGRSNRVPEQSADEPLLTAEQMRDLRDLLYQLRHNHGGWGLVVIKMRRGQVIRLGYGELFLHNYGGEVEKDDGC